METLRIAVVGVGRAGGALGRALAAVGFPIAAVWSRTPAHAQALADATGALVAESPAAAAHHADLVILAVIDSLLIPFSEQIASLPPRPGAMAVHLSGANDATALGPLRSAGWQTGAFHPLQTFANAHAPILPGTAFAIDAAEPLHAALYTLATRLGGVPITIQPQDRALYHAAATMASNYTVALVAQAAHLLAQCGLDSQTALAALLPLLQGTMENLATLRLPTALTGPIARGDTATIERHLATLAERAPDVLPLYRVLGAATVPLARAQGGNPAALDSIAELLDVQ